MTTFLIFSIVYAYTWFVWVLVLVIYNLLIESFDFGPLGAFAWKSAILIFIVALVIMNVPFGALASLLVWLVGLLVILKRDLWECRVLVIMIWGAYFVVSLLMDMVLRGLFTMGEG